MNENVKEKEFICFVTEKICLKATNLCKLFKDLRNTLFYTQVPSIFSPKSAFIIDPHLLYSRLFVPFVELSHIYQLIKCHISILKS